ncbi:MAG: PAS domain-containing protein [Desulfobacterales bacterium]|jgi:hypothetical protein
MAAISHDNSDLIRSVFDALPSMVFVVDQDARIQECNAAAEKMVVDRGSAVIDQRCGEVLSCLHAGDDPRGCGRGPHCKICVVRDVVKAAFEGGRVVRRRIRLEVVRDGAKAEIFAYVSASPFHYKDRDLVLLVVEDISEIAELQRLISICSYCGKLKDDQASWIRLEAYLKAHWGVNFSHGICPDCYEKEIYKLHNGSQISKGDATSG